VHFPSADVQLQWEERIPLGGGPKRQHSSVQALQNNKKVVQKVKRSEQKTKKTVQKSEEKAAGSRAPLHLSLLIKHGLMLESAIRDCL